MQIVYENHYFGVCISRQIIRAKNENRLCCWRQNAFLLVCFNVKRTFFLIERLILVVKEIWNVACRDKTKLLPFKHSWSEAFKNTFISK